LASILPRWFNSCPHVFEIDIPVLELSLAPGALYEDDAGPVVVIPGVNRGLAVRAVEKEDSHLLSFRTGDDLGQSDDMVPITFRKGSEELFKMDIGEQDRCSNMNSFEFFLEVEKPS